jgi:hypothetical protein
MQFRLARLGQRFSREDWNLGVIPQSVEDIVRHGITRPIHWWPDCKPYEMFADPSCVIDSDGTYILFAEHLDYRIGRGEIWAARVPATMDLTRTTLQPWMRSSSHLSYPRPVMGPMDRLFFMAEAWETGALHLWQREDDNLKHVGAIIEEPLLDPTPWHDGTTWWLFCTFRHSGPNDRLQLFYADRLEGPWTAHPRNPVKTNRGSSRPAGPLIWVDGEMIRPAQDCTETYGGGIQLNQITRLDKDGFEEVVVRRLRPAPKYPDGLHTLCPAADMTLIDGKRWSFSGRDIPHKVLVSVAGRVRPRSKHTLPQQVALPTC